MTVTIESDGWIQEAIGIYWPNLTFGPFTQGEPRWIVLHGTASGDGSTAEGIAHGWERASKAGGGNASTHLLINKDGSYVQGLSLLQTAWGNSGASNSIRAPFLPSSNLNQCTISIEHIKYDMSHNSDIITPLQQVASFQLVRSICDFWDIPKKVITIDDCSQGGIIRHKDCDGLNRPYCPGPYPFAALAAYLQGDHMSPHFNEMVVDVWGSNFVNAPKRDTGIFNEWRKQFLQGHFKGVPLGGEYPCHNPDTGAMTVAQNFAGGTCLWNNGNPTWL